MKQQTSPILQKELIEPILTWYRQNRRMLPWREGKEPYRIWISEIMLQQTRIEAVIPYYHRFLEELPTVEALANVPDDRLMKLWEGLGYYSRARNLKKAAIQTVNEHGGVLPPDFDALRRLSGIGDYTAGAIASIAYGLPEPAVDGNVLRVVMRLTGREDDIAQASTKKEVTEWLREIYPSGEDAGDLTEGIMELGEKICIPAGVPKCDECPLREQCVARRDNTWSTLPKKSPKKERRTEDHTVLILHCDGKIALRKRPKEGLLAGLWEFPSLSGKRSVQEIEELLQGKSLAPEHIIPCGDATHIFTHITWNMTGISVQCSLPSDEFFWFTPDELRRDVAIPTAFRFYLRYILSNFDH
ncbi:MAG: A/G-specific adenine glycosylase [Clostridia bacterium]|nr:A/G-specific adenine glycosylase [Clostridia bacterium]